MSEMVERCVKALEENLWDWREAPAKVVVRVVMEAIREPSDAAIKAGAHVWDNDWCTETNALNMWQAMIDEALK